MTHKLNVCVCVVGVVCSVYIVPVNDSFYEYVSLPVIYVVLTVFAHWYCIDNMLVVYSSV